MVLAKHLGGFHNMPRVLQAPFSPWESPLGALSEWVWLHKQAWVRKRRVWVTVRQLLRGNCPPACPCPTASVSAESWGELLRSSSWAGRREFVCAVRAEEVQSSAFTAQFAAGSSCVCLCLGAGSVPERFPGKRPGAGKSSFWEALVSSARQQSVGRLEFKPRTNSKSASSHPFGNLEFAVSQYTFLGLRLFLLLLSAPAFGVRLCPLRKGVSKKRCCFTILWKQRLLAALPWTCQHPED